MDLDYEARHDSPRRRITPLELGVIAAILLVLAALVAPAFQNVGYRRHPAKPLQSPTATQPTTND